jgi:hypothetical protein
MFWHLVVRADDFAWWAKFQGFHGKKHWFDSIDVCVPFSVDKQIEGSWNRTVCQRTWNSSWFHFIHLKQLCKFVTILGVEFLIVFLFSHHCLFSSHFIALLSNMHSCCISLSISYIFSQIWIIWFDFILSAISPICSQERPIAHVSEFSIRWHWSPSPPYRSVSCSSRIHCASSQPSHCSRSESFWFTFVRLDDRFIS